MNGKIREKEKFAKTIAKVMLSEKSEFIPRFLDYLVYSYKNSRTGISHGLDIEYPNANDSTKLVLALYELYTVIQATKESSPN